MSASLTSSSEADLKVVVKGVIDKKEAEVYTSNFTVGDIADHSSADIAATLLLPPQTSLFPILPTMVPTILQEVTRHTLWKCQVHPVGCDEVSETYSQSFGSEEPVVDLEGSQLVLPYTCQREREVSSMGGRSGSTGHSRSGPRLAKKERRQKAKDGHGDEAFAGDDESCEDEGMTEIVVKTPKHPTTDQSPNDWATCMLDPTTTFGASDAPVQASSRSNLRRGKRDLMRSWLDTPALGVLEQDRSTEGSPIMPPSPPQLAPPSNSSILDNNTLSTTSVQNGPSDVLSPTYISSEPLISLTGVVVSFGDHSPITSITCFDDGSATPGDDAGSSISVRHARPRDTIRSIQAMRSSSSTFMDHHSISFRRPHLPQVSFMSSANAYPNNLRRMSQKQLPDSKATHSFSAGLTSELPADVTLQLSLHPGPKPRNVVTFNADAYNLDAWDADVMGLFALPTEGVTTVCGLKLGMEMSLSKCSAVVSSRSMLLSPEVEDLPQTSMSILSAYFDQSPSNQVWTATDPLSQYSDDCQQHRHIESEGERNQRLFVDSGDVDFDECDSLSRGDIYCQTIVHPTTSSAVQYVVSPRDEGMLSANTSRTSSTANTTILYHEHLKHKDYLLQVAVEHAKSTSQSLLPPDHSDAREQRFTVGVSSSILGDCNIRSPVYKGANVDDNLHGSCFGDELPHQQESFHHQRSIPSPVCDAYTISTVCTRTTSEKPERIYSFSEIVSKFVTLDTLVHEATSYTEQLANPVSGTGTSKKGSQDRWDMSTVPDSSFI